MWFSWEWVSLWITTHTSSILSSKHHTTNIYLFLLFLFNLSIDLLSLFNLSIDLFSPFTLSIDLLFLFNLSIHPSLVSCLSVYSSINLNISPSVSWKSSYLSFLSSPGSFLFSLAFLEEKSRLCCSAQRKKSFFCLCKCQHEKERKWKEVCLFSTPDGHSTDCILHGVYTPTSVRISLSFCIYIYGYLHGERSVDFCLFSFIFLRLLGDLLFAFAPPFLALWVIWWPPPLNMK